MSAWNSTTSTTATARRPSMSGRNPSGRNASAGSLPDRSGTRWLRSGSIGADDELGTCPFYHLSVAHLRGRHQRSASESSERLVHQIGKLLVVDRLRARGGAATLAPADVADVVPALFDPPRARLDEVPRPHVLRLFLQPDQLASVRIVVEHGHH